MQRLGGLGSFGKLESGEGMMKQRNLYLLMVVLFGLSLPLLSQSVAADFDVICIVDDSVANPNSKTNLIRTPMNDPCAQLPGIKYHLGSRVNLLIQYPEESSIDDINQPAISKLVLFLNAHAQPGTTPTLTRSEPDASGVMWAVLSFPIERELSTPEGRKAWKYVITGGRFGKNIAVSTGLPDGEAVPSTAQINLEILTLPAVAMAVLAAIILAIIFILLLLRTGALRDKEPAQHPGMDPTRRAYSLSRVQAALWTLLVMYAFLFVYFLTGEYNATIPSSIVVLMSVSLGTLTTAAAVDAANSNRNREKADTLFSKVAENTEPQDSPQNRALLNQAGRLLNRSKVAYKSGFWEDLFSNSGGAGLHRVQYGIWTLVLMVVFLFTVFNTVAMPQFDSTLLALMGVSSGAYASLKIPENKDSTDTQND
jgi:hypothetical protein